MFTGRYPHETGTLSNADISRDVSAFRCLGAMFRDAGYDTGYAGKWHLPYPIEDSAAHGFGFRANNVIAATSGSSARQHAIRSQM